MNDEQPVHSLNELCTAADPSTCDHAHVTLYDTDPVLGYLADLINKHGIRRGGIKYDKE